MTFFSITPKNFLRTLMLFGVDTFCWLMAPMICLVLVVAIRSLDPSAGVKADSTFYWFSFVLFPIGGTALLLSLGWLNIRVARRTSSMHVLGIILGSFLYVYAIPYVLDIGGFRSEAHGFLSWQLMRLFQEDIHPYESSILGIIPIAMVLAVIDLTFFDRQTNE